MMQQQIEINISERLNFLINIDNFTKADKEDMKKRFRHR